MSRRITYLSRRGPTFQLRLPVPRDLHSQFGRKELRWSLAVCDEKVARRKTFQASLAFENLCTYIRRMQSLDASDVVDLTRQFYQSLVAKHRLLNPITGDPDAFDQEQRVLSEDVAEGFRDQLERKLYSAETKRSAREFLKQRGLDSSSNVNLEKALFEGVTRANIEYVRYTRFKQTSALDPYEPSDALFQQPKTVQLIASDSGAVDGSKTTTAAPGERLGDLIRRYLDAGVTTGTTAHGPWTSKTRDEKAKSLAWFENLVGSSIEITSITTEHVRSCRDGIRALKKGSARGGSLASRKASSASQRIDPSSAAKLFGFVQEFLRWAEKEQFISTAPGRTLGVDVPKKPKSKQRRPPTHAELNKLFSSPLFTGFRSLRQRHKPGPLTARDDEFYLPLVLLYTGMRISEPLHIAAEDVHIDGPNPFFRLLRTKIELKNDASERDVPIHPELIATGFLDFVRSRQKQNPKGRLFGGITSQGDLGNYYSQRFGRYIRRCGIEDPLVVTHSLRHLVKDVLRDAKIPEEDRNRITGHSSGTVASSYGKGASIETLWEYMAKANFGLTVGVKKGLLT